MEELLLKEIKVGDVVRGEIISLKDNVAIVDLHQFTEGTIYLNEYDPKLASLKDALKVGDELEAVVKKVDEEHGKILLSCLPLLKKASDKVMAEYSQSHKTISFKVEKNNGYGLVGSYLGNQVFVPYHEMDLDKNANPDSFVGKTIEVRLRDFDDRRKRYFASRRELMYEAYQNEKQAEFDTIHVGDVIEGKVTRIDNHLGAFVRLRKYNQGLIRFKELSHTPIKSINDVLIVGDEVLVKVIRIEGNKIDLSRKALIKTPFEQYCDEHKISDVVEGTVVQKLPIGAIVEVAPFVRVLLHINEISWNPNDNTFASLKLGSPVKAAIISIDKKKEKMSLSMKVLENNPWAKVSGNVGDTVKCEITNIVSGKNLEVSALGVTGIIPVNQVTMKEKSSRLEDYYAVGDKVDAIITYIDPKQWKLELSIKKLDDRLERQQFEDFQAKEQAQETKITLGDLYKFK